MQFTTQQQGRTDKNVNCAQFIYYNVQQKKII